MLCTPSERPLLQLLNALACQAALLDTTDLSDISMAILVVEGD